MRRAISIILEAGSTIQPRIALASCQPGQQALYFATDGRIPSHNNGARPPQPPVTARGSRQPWPSSISGAIPDSAKDGTRAPTEGIAAAAEPRRAGKPLADVLGLKNRLRQVDPSRSRDGNGSGAKIGASHAPSTSRPIQGGQLERRASPVDPKDRPQQGGQQQPPTRLSQQHGSDPNRSSGWRQQFAQRVPRHHRGQGPPKLPQGPQGPPRNLQWRPRQQGGPQQQRPSAPRPPQRGRPAADRGQQPFRSTAGGGDRRPFRQRRDEDPELSAAEKAAWRAEYMGFTPDMDKAYDQIEAMTQSEGDHLDYDAGEGGVLSDQEMGRLVQSFTEEDWEALYDYERSVMEGQRTGVLKTDKQHAMLEEWAEEVEEAPPPPDKAEYVFDSEEDRDFHRSLQLDYEPEYNFMIGPPRRRTAEELDPVKVMEYYKPAIMEEMGIGSDMEYERQAARTIDGIEELLPVLLPNDAWANGQRLDTIAELVPAENNMAPHIRSSIEEIKKNPFWRQDQKELFITRLVRGATS